MYEQKIRLLFCMDCEEEFYGEYDGDGDLILCPTCTADFHKWVQEDEEYLSYTLYWHGEFIKECGDKHTRRKNEKEKSINAILAELLDM